jgi:WD40 repeat protein/DNA-binding SARP family transcriptional activator
MHVSVLGPVEVSVDGRLVPIGAGKPRALLTLLALHEGVALSTDRLVEGLWGEEPPASATKMVQLLVSQLRKALAGAGDGAAIVTRGRGYELHLGSGGLDATRFEQLIAAGMPREALALWRGAPLLDVAEEPFAIAEIRRLEELHLRAVELAVERDLAAGRHAQVVGELELLVAQEALRERFHAQRMLALYRCGRQADALDAYRAARAALIDAIGVEPGPELRDLQEAILRQDPALDLRPQALELPPELAVTTPLLGRDDEVAWLRERWRAADSGTGTMVLVAGPPGIGKTRLVAELADELRCDGVSVVYAASEDTAGAEAALASAAATPRPTLVVLDDLDRAGEGVKAAARDLADGLGARPLLLLATARAPERALLSHAAQTLSLASLTPQDVEALGCLYSPHDADAGVSREWLVAASGGVPARVHEAAREWSRAEIAERLAGAAGRAATERAELRTAEDELAGRVVELQAATERRAAPPDADGLVVCPFKGLASFEEDDAGFFCGRERLIAEMVARLAGAPLMGIVGPSGSGKSSALRAGLLPALANGVLPGSRRWELTLLRPGEHPMRSFERGAGGGSERRVIAVDQFEEVFSACRDEGERTAFVDALVAEARDPYRPAFVLVTVRADFYGRCASFPELWRLLGASQVTVGPMRRDELRRAIELPAQRAGLRVEPALTDALVADVEGEPGALPLLSASLLELWQQRDGRTLRMGDYERAGGVRSAVARLAEAAYGRLDREQRDLARWVLMRLAGDGEGDAVVRRRVPLAELEARDDDRVADVLSVLADDRLVTVGDEGVEVAHEALLREWPRLRSWLQEDAEGRRMQRHLLHAAREWESAGRDPAELYRGARLTAALEWTADRDVELTAPEREFVAASRAAAEEEAERRRVAHRRLQGLLVALAGLLLLAVLAGAVALSQRGEARDAAQAADAQRLGAQALIDDHLEHALLLARAGVALDDSPATRSSLLAVLQRSPAALSVLRGDGPPLIPAALSPDGRLLAVGGDDGTVTVFDARNRSVVGKPYVLRDGLVQKLVFSPDGTTLAVGGHEPQNEPPGALVDLIDPRTGVRRLRVKLPRFPGGSLWVVLSIAFAPGGRDLVVQQSHNAAPDAPPSVLWRVNGRTGGLDGGPLRVGRIGPMGASATGDGRFLYVTSPRDDATWKLDARRLRLLERFPVGDLAGAVSPDGLRFALGSERGGVRVLDLRSRRVTHFAGRHSASVNAMRFTPDGRTLVTSGGDGEVIAWDVAAGAIRESFSGHTGQVWGLAISADGRTLVSAGLDGRAIVWDLAGDRRLDRHFSAGRPFRAGDGDDYPVAPVLAPDGRELALTQSDGSVELVDTTTLQSRRRVRALDGFAAAAAYSPDGRTLTVSGEGGQVRMLDARSLRPLRPDLIGLRATSQALAFSPDGRLLAAGSNEAGSTPGDVRVWDVRRRDLLPVRFGTAAGSLAFNRDGSQLAAAGVDQGTLIRDVRSGRLVRRLRNQDFARTVAYSPDGALLAVGLYDGKTELWATKSWKRVGRSLALHTARVLSIDFSPDGQTLVTSSADGTIALWDVATQKPLGARLTLDPDVFVSAAFGAAGSHVFAVSQGGKGVRWDVRPASWSRRACLIAGRELTREEWREALPERSYARVCNLR